MEMQTAPAYQENAQPEKSGDGESGEGNLLVDAWESIKSFGSGVKQAATGEGVELEFPDVTELTEIDDNSVGFWESLPANLKLGFVRDNAQKAEILSKSFEGDERFGGIFSDKFDNPMVVWNEQPYYLNKPGLTGQDWQTFAGEILKYLPASKWVSGAKSFIGTLGRGIPTYTTTEVGARGVESLLAPETTQAKEQTITDIAKESGTVGAISAGVEAVIPPVARGVGRVAKAAVAPATAMVFPHLSKFTGQFKEAFADLLPPTVVSESKYPLTIGQRTADPPFGITPRHTKIIEEEDVMRHAPSGSPKGGGTITIRGFDDVQLGQIRNDAIALQDEFGSGTIGSERATDDIVGRVPEAAVETVQQVVSGAAADLKRRSGEAYKAVRTAETPPVMTPSGVVETAARIRNTVLGTSDDSMGVSLIELGDMPLVKRELEFIDRVSKIFAKRAGDDFIMQGSKDIPIRQLHAYQKRLRRAIDSADPRSPEGFALSRMKQELDDSIYRGIDEGFMYGDEQVLNQLKSATSLYRDYMRITGQGFAKGPRGRANQILQKLSDRDWDAPRLAGTLLGHSKFNPAQSIRMVIDDLKSILPEDQYDEVIGSLKDAVLEKAFTNAKGDVSRRAIVNNYNQIFIKNKKVAEALFSPEEIARIKQFRKDVLPTLWAELKLNPPGSGYVMLGGLARAGLMSTGLRAMAALPLVAETGKALQTAEAASAAREAVRQYLRKNQTRWISIPSSAKTRTIIDEEVSGDSPASASPSITTIIESLPQSAQEKLINLQ